MANEAGDMKLLGNFSRLIELVSVNADYNPANTALRVASLNTQKTAVSTAISDVGAQQAPFKAAVNDRQAAFDEMRPVVTRAGNMLQASGSDQLIQDDVRTLQRKISGSRKSPKVKDDPNTPQNEAAASQSASQQSYDNLVGNFEGLIALLGTVPSYTPNEPDLTIASLQARAASLRAKNDAVNNTFAPLSAARGARDGLLYTNDDGLVNTALLVKAYVRAAFGPDSQLFKSIKGLEFKRPNK
jgi:hypothetical protein